MNNMALIDALVSLELAKEETIEGNYLQASLHCRDAYTSYRQARTELGRECEDILEEFNAELNDVTDQVTWRL